MNREIKFRAWTGTRMKDPDDLFHIRSDGQNGTYDCSEGSYGGGHWDVPGGSEANECDVLMQYTGLKDKNGKEIWEGDVIKTYDKAVKGGHATGYVIMNEGAWHIAGCYFGYHIHPWAYAMEVIGNIHQNPELL